MTNLLQRILRPLLVFQLFITLITMSNQKEYDDYLDDGANNSSNLIVNIITGGHIHKLTHLDHSENHYSLELTKIAKALSNETCGGFSLIDVVNGVLSKKGVIDIDLRNLLMGNDTMSHLTEPLTSNATNSLMNQINGKTQIGHVATTSNLNDNGSENLIDTTKQYSNRIFSRTSNVENFSEDKSSFVEQLSSKGPHSESVSESRLDLSRMFASAPRLDSWRDDKSPDKSLEYFQQKLSYYMKKLDSLAGDGPTLIQTPMDICRAYTNARKKIHDAYQDESSSLLKILKFALDSFLEIIRIRNYSEKHGSPVRMMGMIADHANQNQSVVSLDLHELRTLRREISMQIGTLEKFVNIAHIVQERSRAKRSLSYISSLTEGIFTGYIKSGDIDVMSYIGDQLLYPKLRISNRIFTSMYWPECMENSAIQDLLGKDQYRSAMVGFMTSHGICFFNRFCDSGSVISPQTMLCTPVSSVTNKHLSNIRSLGISDFIHRIGTSELDDTLERKFHGYCSVGGINVSPCRDTIASREMISIARLGGEWIILRNDIHIGYTPNLDAITSYECTASNASQLDSKENPGFIKGCNKGDDNYMKRFHGAEHCSCEVSLKAGDIGVKYYEKLVPLDFILQIEVVVKKPASVPDKRRCTDCGSQCKDGHLLITNIPKYDLLSVCKMSNCEYFKISHQKETFSLANPKPLLGNVTVKFYPNSTDLEPYVGYAMCSIKNYCSLIKCTLCKDFLMNPHCQPGYSIIIWSLILIIPVILINLISSIIGTFYKIISFMIKILRIGFSCCKVICKALGRISRKKADVAFTTLQEVSMDSGDDTITTHEYRPVRQGRHLRPLALKPISPVTLVLILGLFIAITTGCSMESIITTDSLHCSGQGFGSHCKIKQDVQISLSPVGQISCINIKKEGLEDILTQIQIKTKNLRLLCNPSILYYTSSVMPMMTSTYRCSGAGSCNDENCKKVKRSDSVEDIPTKNVFNITGESGCRLVNGFWGNSCFYADSACKYYRVYFSPKGDTMEVFNCPTWEWIAELEITTIGSTIISETIYLSSSQPYVKNDLTIRMTSVSVKPNILYNKCFLRRVAKKYEGDPIAVTSCNSKTEATKGLIGEIQCPTAKDADEMTLQCSYIENLFSLTVNGNDLVFRPGVLDVDEIYQSSLLPLQYPGLTLENNKLGVPYINTHEATLFTLHFTMREYKVSITESKVECGTTFVNLTGCYKCDSGARLCLDSTASDYPAVFRMICPNTIPQLKTIAKKGVWCLNLPLTSENIDIECETTCGMEKTKLGIKGSLIYIPNKMPSYQNSTIIDNVLSEDFYMTFISWFKGLSLSSYIYLIISLFLGIILSYIILWIILPMVLKGIRHLCVKKAKATLKSHKV